MAKRRVGKYPLSFRQMAMERMKDCPSVSALAEELGVDRSNLYQWQRQPRRSEYNLNTHPDDLNIEHRFNTRIRTLQSHLEAR